MDAALLLVLVPWLAIFGAFFVQVWRYDWQAQLAAERLSARHPREYECLGSPQPFFTHTLSRRRLTAISKMRRYICTGDYKRLEDSELTRLCLVAWRTRRWVRVLLVACLLYLAAFPWLVPWAESAVHG
jgi:hypothetical protein